MVQDHLVPVAPGGYMRKLTRLIGVDCVMGVVGLDKYVMVVEGG